MRFLLLTATVGLLAAAGGAAAISTPGPRIWLASPSVVSGSGFPEGVVTVTARTPGHTIVRITRASKAGRFAARFETPLRPTGCRPVMVTAAGRSQVRSVLRVPGSARDCAQPFDP